MLCIMMKKIHFTSYFMTTNKLMWTRLCCSINAKKNFQDQHIYRCIHPCKTSLELATHLKSAEIYHSGDLIVLNRPYGIPKLQQNSEKLSKTSLNTGGLDSHELSIEKTIPYLKDIYQTNYLEIVGGMDRWTSGVMLLSKSEKMSQKLSKCLARYIGFPEIPYKEFWAVTLGCPSPKIQTKKVGIGLQNVPGLGDMPVLKHDFSKTSIKKRLIKSIYVHHELLDYNLNYDTALVKINASGTKHHFLRLWLANNFSPVLGDFLCGGRVKTVMGVKVLASEASASSYLSVIPETKILNSLLLTENTLSTLPCHIHFAKLVLKNFFSKSNKDRNLELYAEPPPHFIWSCKQLGLKIEEQINFDV